MRSMRKPSTAPKLRSRVSFARPDAQILLFNEDAEEMPPAWPAVQDLEVDDEVNRQHGGVPIASGHAHYFISLDSHPEAAGFARVVDIRTGQTTDYDIVQTDDNVRDWVYYVRLVQRQAPIGLQ